MDRTEYLRRVKFITRFAKAMHKVGSPAHTLEGILNLMSQRFGIKGHFLSLPTSIVCGYEYEEYFETRLERVEPAVTQLAKLSRVDLIARKVIHEEMTLDEGIKYLDELDEADLSMSSYFIVLAFMVTSIGIVTLFGGTWGDFFCAAIVGLIIGVFSLPNYYFNQIQVFEAVIAFVATFSSTFLGNLSYDINPSIISLGALIILMPGLNITLAIAEIVTNNLTSGSSRLMGALMALIKITSGAYVGSYLANYLNFGGHFFSFSPLPKWLIFFTLPVAALSSTVLFKADKKDAPWIMLAGICGFCSSKFGAYIAGPEIGALTGGIFMGAGSNIFARLRQMPSSIFQIPGIILMVPGSVGYRSINALMSNQAVDGFNTAFTMVLIAFSLVTGLFIGNTLVKPRESF